MPNKSSKKKYVPSKKFKKHLEERASKFDMYKGKKDVKTFLNTWKDDNLQNPFEVTKKFIQEKGLKIYGGLALHEHLKKKKNPIYDKSEFPDYDVFSPNAWEHAKELCDQLYKMGFYFVEARSSILNNEKHQTYKVSVDMIYILDLTQSGCTSIQLKNKDCSKCGLSKDKKCISIFNNIPCYNILEKQPKEYTKIFDYKNDISLYPKKLFVCSPDWLKISMYRELTEPLSNPDRLEKIGSRLKLFSENYPYMANKCELYSVDKKTNVSQTKHLETHKSVLNYLEKYLNDNKYIYHGGYAYNFFIKGSKFSEIPIYNHEVYTQFDHISDFNPLINTLSRKFKDYKFKIQESIIYWKEVDVKDFVLFGKKGNGQYGKLATFTFNTECLPFIKYNNKRYVTIDRMKYHFFRNIALYDVVKHTEKYILNYPCLLDNLLKIEDKIKNKYPLQDKGKFRRFELQCEGNLLDKLKSQLFTRFGEKVNLMKQTKYIIDNPSPGIITKQYPTPDAKTKLPFVPAERELKKYFKYSPSSKKIVKYKSHTLDSKKKPFLFNNSDIL
jgi:hypothetical protein